LSYSIWAFEKNMLQPRGLKRPRIPAGRVAPGTFQDDVLLNTDQLVGSITATSVPATGITAGNLPVGVKSSAGNTLLDTASTYAGALTAAQVNAVGAITNNTSGSSGSVAAANVTGGNLPVAVKSSNGTSLPTQDVNTTGNPVFQSAQVSTNLMQFGTGVDTRLLAFDSTAGGCSVEIPGLTGTLGHLTKQQTVYNKNMVDSTNYFVNVSDQTKKMKFDLSNVTTGQTRTVIIPPTYGSDVMVLDSTIQSISNKKLVAPTLADNGDFTKVVSLDMSAISTGTTRAWAFPNAAGTQFVGTTAAQTLSSKTFAYESNTVNSLQAYIEKQTTQSLSTSTYTQITSWVAGVDSSSGGGTAFADPTNSRLKLFKAGRWLLYYTVYFASSATGYRAAEIRIATGSGAAGSSAAISCGETNLNSGASCGWTHSLVYTTAATTDYVYLYAWQNSGGALNFGSTAANNYSRLGAIYLGAV
jgi:hypothetical protein